MSEWKKVKLGDICDSQYGYTASTIEDNTGTKFLRITDIVPNQIDWDAVPFCNISNKERDKYILHKGDIVVARTGATVGYAKYIKQDVQSVFASYLVRFVVKREDVFSQYVGYCVESSLFKDYINSIANGSAQPNANSQMMSSFEFKIPSLPTQHRIATILSRYESLIENYQKQIKLLEEAAQRLYKEWFVDLHFPGHESTKIIDGVPEGWEKRKIEELVNIKSGYAFKSKDWQSKGHPVVKIKDINGTFVLSDSLDCVPITVAKKANQFILRTGDLVIAMTGATIGKVGIVTEDNIYTNQRVGKFFVKDRFTLPFLYCYFKQKSTIDLVLKISSSSAAQPNISGSQLGSFVFMYNKELLDKYCDKVQYLFQKIIMLQKQARLLTEARDRLLPKLISGDIKV